ncbi:MAG: hypothetical protein WD645_01380 [Dehalococcoidia bacterium]
MQGKSRQRITVDLGSVELYRALRMAAVQRDLPMREVIIEAIEEWLARKGGAGAVNGGEGAE